MGKTLQGNIDTKNTKNSESTNGNDQNIDQCASKSNKQRKQKKSLETLNRKIYAQSQLNQTFFQHVVQYGAGHPYKLRDMGICFSTCTIINSKKVHDIHESGIYEGMSFSNPKFFIQGTIIDDFETHNKNLKAKGNMAISNQEFGA